MQKWPARKTRWQVEVKAVLVGWLHQVVVSPLLSRTDGVPNGPTSYHTCTLTVRWEAALALALAP